MGIVTKKGDKGQTCIYKGNKVFKDHIRVEACGVLDELNAFLGAAKNFANNTKVKRVIEEIQKSLFVAGAEIATETSSLKKLKKRINEKNVRNIEKYILELEKKNTIRGKCFCVPGKNIASSFLDICRATVRKAERRTVTLKRKKALKNDYLLVYLNRLSDLLYLLARFYDTKAVRGKRVAEGRYR
ncbi:MAG: cob(I)yrinic acid a,c-diamide adenosyltransferase [Candidatus Omnitrophica bacterium]|nr:cob(I)yrinic acid a,c-diamide adenosyltransferase [Candidatus Omnitrophota bacterium]MDD5429982.1 cob(I)yrinic acid a,c-diamide adenosyltransferase [Candidatus Omnitrophota bacterium]